MSMFSKNEKCNGKRIMLTILLCTFIFAQTALGAVSGSGGGFSGPGPDVTTVKQALQMNDDSRISLRGKIVRSLGDEMYLFQDATGTIEVEIDYEVWRGLNVTPEDTVVISGEVDRDWSRRTIDVSSVVKE